MSSPHYSVQEESVNFGGGNSNSAGYGLQDTAGEIATGYSASASHTVHAGYQQSSNAVPVVPPPTPVIVPPTNVTASTAMPGSSLPLPNPTGFTATPLSNGIALMWQNPTDARFIQVRVVRSTTFFPESESEGDLIYQGPEQSFFDASAVPGVTYYYAIFAEGPGTLVSSGALAYAHMPVIGEAATTTPPNPFVNVPMAPHVDPMIASLSLADFEFIQDGKLLPVGTGGTVTINGYHDLTIRLRYDRVPQILKTIALALADPTDHSKAFIFLLRPNADKTYYTATMGPLGKSGSYPLTISILDYQNQGLKQLAGALNAYAAAVIMAVGGDLGWIWILALILATIVVAIIVCRHYRDNGKNRKGGSSGKGPAAPVRDTKEIPPPPAFTSIPMVPVVPIVPSAVSVATPIVVALIIFALAFKAFVPIAAAAFNPEVNYQGKLMDATGATVPDGAYNVEFKLYTAASGGVPVWTEDELVSASQGAAMKGGLFSVMLGAVTPFGALDFNQPLYLSVNIGGTGASPSWDGEMSPRKILGAVPAAFEATNAQTAGRRAGLE